MPYACANVLRISVQVSASQVPKASGIQPTTERAARLSDTTSKPPTRASPWSGASSPARISSRVVLPEPLGPISAVTAPDGAVKLMPSTARTSPKARRRPCASIPGEAADAASGSSTAIGTALMIEGYGPLGGRCVLPAGAPYRPGG